MKVKCPNCRKETVYDPTNKYRPFCSERCATLDLGAWADEEYKVPVEHSETEENPLNQGEDDNGKDRLN